MQLPELVMNCGTQGSYRLVDEFGFFELLACGVCFGEAFASRQVDDRDESPFMVFDFDLLRVGAIGDTGRFDPALFEQHLDDGMAAA
jgi:hypothetical protein